MNTPSRTEWNGRYRALVIDDRDPLFKMRVKVRIPDLMIADEKHVGKWDTNGLWASPSNNYLGGRTIQDTKMRHKGPDAYYQGSCLIPPKGTHVWVWFEKNDISHPFYDGAAEYGDVQALPENQLGKDYQKKWTLLKTCQGRCIIASDDNSDARWEITGKKREIKNPPFGDTDSVYKIDDNQTTFLIDERPNHEKVLLKDYRGNFIKLIQDENGVNDQLHMKIKNDVHWECQKDVYWTILGNLHLKVLGDIYITSLKNIFVSATLQLRETALSFDRFSLAFDNKTSGLVNVLSFTNINHTAVMEIFEESVLNVRNSMITSDVSVGLTSITAGAAIGLLAGGAVSIYGGGGTAIQSTPVSLPLTGFTLPALMAPLSNESKPDPERYEKIEFSGKAPILTTPTGKSSLSGDKVVHPSVQTSQAASAQVGADDGAYDHGGGGGSVGSSGGGGASQGASSAEAGGCCGGGGTSDSDTIDIPDIQPQSQTISSCCGGAVQTALQDIRSVNQSESSMLGWLQGFLGGVADELYACVAGVVPNPYEVKDLFMNQILEQGCITYSPYASNMFDVLGQDLSNTLIGNLNVLVPNLTGLPIEVFDSFSSDYTYLNTSFLRQSLNYISNGLADTFMDQVPDSYYYANSLMNNVLTAIEEGTNFARTVDWWINDYTTDFCDGCVNHQCIDIRKDYMSHTACCSSITTDDIRKITYDQCKSLSDEMCQSIDANSDHVKELIEDTVHIPPEEGDEYMSQEQLQANLQKLKDAVTNFQDMCHDETEIEKFKEDPDYFDEVSQQFTENCKEIIRENPLSDEEASKKFAEADSQAAAAIEKSLNPIIQETDSETISKQLDNVNNIIYNNLETDEYELTSSYTRFEEDLKLMYSNRVSEKLKAEFENEIHDLVATIPEKDRKDPSVLATVREKIEALIEKFKAKISEEGFLATIITEEDIKVKIDELSEQIDKNFPRRDNNTAEESIKEFSNELETTINSKRKETLGEIFDLVNAKDGQFSKNDTTTYTVPNMCGCGYDNLLFLDDKYRKTIAPLISNSGGNVLSFNLITDTSTLQYTTSQVWDETKKQFIEKRVYHPFFNEDAIKSYEFIWDNLATIDTSTKWWQNLREVLIQASILDLTVVITLQDFSSKVNPFIKGISEDKRYIDSMWRDDVEGKFYKTLYDFVKETQCKVIYNLGSKSYHNESDPDNTKYKIYPNCSYMRRFIMWTVYKCGVTSNMLAITADEDDNLYYYNPYGEWKSYDDDVTHQLEDSELTVKDYVDEKTNDDAEVVTYDNNDKIKGGYAKYLIDCSKHSIPVFAMQDLVAKIPDGADISDPNIMSMIFCFKSRTAIRYFKTDKYFNFTELQFDSEGDVI